MSSGKPAAISTLAETREAKFPPIMATTGNPARTEGKLLQFLDFRVSAGENAGQFLPASRPREEQASMQVIATALPEIKIYMPKRRVDGRGYFSEWYNARDLAAAGLDRHFVQDNVVLSTKAWTVRGLHFQTPPHAQGKLVGVLRGAAFDVVVDIRAGSPSFGRSVSVELSAEEGNQVFVPEGFAHGICNRVPDTLVGYKVTEFFDAACDKGIAWNDPALGIAWPVEPARAIISERDGRMPKLAEFDPLPFRYEGRP